MSNDITRRITTLLASRVTEIYPSPSMKPASHDKNEGEMLRYGDLSRIGFWPRSLFQLILPIVGRLLYTIQRDEIVATTTNTPFLILV